MGQSLEQLGTVIHLTSYVIESPVYQKEPAIGETYPEVVEIYGHGNFQRVSIRTHNTMLFHQQGLEQYMVNGMEYCQFSPVLPSHRTLNTRNCALDEHAGPRSPGTVPADESRFIKETRAVQREIEQRNADLYLPIQGLVVFPRFSIESEIALRNMKRDRSDVAPYLAEQIALMLPVVTVSGRFLPKAIKEKIAAMLEKDPDADHHRQDGCLECLINTIELEGTRGKWSIEAILQCNAKVLEESNMRFREVYAECEKGNLQLAEILARSIVNPVLSVRYEEYEQDLF